MSATADIGASLKNEYKELIEGALVNLNAMSSKEWTFKQVETIDNEEKISTFDPRKPKSEQWTLLLVDNKKPSKQETDDFNSARNSALNSDDSEGREQSSESNEEPKKVSIELSDMIVKDSLTFKKLENELVHFSFTPLIQKMEDEQKNLSGLLIVNLISEQVEFMSVKNIDDLSPAFSVSLENFNLAFEFGQVESKPVLVKMTMDLSGTVGFFKSIEQHTKQEFLNYEFIGTPAE
ncbi:MAG: hypothetical protein OCD00_02165 [Colwellia sp.]